MVGAYHSKAWVRFPTFLFAFHSKQLRYSRV